MAALAATSGAGAEDGLLSPRFGAGAPSAASRPSAFVLFSGQHLDSSTRFASGGFKMRPFRPLGDDRFILIASVGAGRWRETRPLALGKESDSETVRAHVVAGAEFATPGGSLGLFVGPEYFRETATDPRGLTLRRDRRWGLRAQIDGWWTPTADTLLTLNVAAGSAKPDLWSRIAWGWRIGGLGYAGPEAGLTASRGGLILRAGLHWSEIAIGGFRLRLSGGAMKESGRPWGAWFTLGSYRNF